MDEKMLARVAAVAFVALAITATAIETTRKPAVVAEVSGPPTDIPTYDPLRDELVHCQLMGAAAANDPDCLRAWALNRVRFLDPNAEASPPDPSELPAAAKTGAR